MRAKHRELFAKFNATFKREMEEVWEKMVQDWERDKDKPNPYAEPVNSKSLAYLLYIPSSHILLLATTERDIRLQLLKEEEADASRGILPPHDISASSFLQTGLKLEEQQ
jgi:hypothetical protein